MNSAQRKSGVVARRWASVSVWSAIFAAIAVTSLRAQSLAERARVRNGEVRLSFATRPEVCGSGRSIHIVQSTDDWERDCEHGPARVVLTWRDGELDDVDTYVGGRWKSAGDDVVDLGMVSAPAAADMLLDFAGRVTARAGEDLIFPATIADSVEIWPRLIPLAKDDRLPQATRKNAIFWLGQAAGERAARDLGALATDQTEDREIQEQAVFALSQLTHGGGVPPLIEIARTHKDPKVRKTAMFWLGQSNDPRAIALFEEILTKK